MAMNGEPVVTPNMLSSTTALFASLGWNVGTGDVEIDERFEFFCRMLASLHDDDERGLMLEVTKDFFHFTLAEYPIGVARVLDEVAPLLETHQVVVAAPLIKPNDVGKIKSGAMAAFMCRPGLRAIEKRTGNVIHVGDRPEIPVLKRKGVKYSPFPSRIVFIDDFLGSGSTAKDTIDAFRSVYHVTLDSIIVVVLIAQRAAIEYLASLGVKVLAAHVRERGISDSGRLKDIPAAIVRMLTIERRLKVSPENSLGRGKAEALVCVLDRCPNNTFPVYWTDKMVQGKRWPAPFKR